MSQNHPYRNWRRRCHLQGHYSDNRKIKDLWNNSGAHTQDKIRGTRGRFWLIWWLSWWLWWGQFWHEEAGCSCDPAFQSLETLHWCFKIDIRWFSTYPMRHVLRGIAHIWRILPRWSSSEILIWGLILDMFGLEETGCGLIDAVTRPRRLH